ncbi:amino acid permease [Pseudomaricurvus sp. HS19]|uniref:APC family permease n=1 Tax=Pseudomaricurvus sp. HS19 TaxID=2692626 RepID=UPI00136D6B9D|nr:amino acid permease [Pseudomaricurvus sp. HS19]
MSGKPALKRVLTLPHLLLYGLGTTIGAGIYALVGELAAVSGYSALASFVLAALLASLTALSFAELSARFPFAGGAATFVREGLGSRHLSTLVGLLVVLAGLVSAAAIINAMIGYLYLYLSWPRLPLVLGLTLLLGLVAWWGIAESVTVAGLITLLELGGLLLVIWVSRGALTGSLATWEPLLEGFHVSHWSLIAAGALLGFYAFIGFEDMVVVAEEVRNVRRTLPLAILLTLLITTLLYLLVMSAALLTFTPQQLAGSSAPLVDVYRAYHPETAWLISGVGMFAIVNGALIQIIMASRVLYGLASRGQLPGWLAQVGARTRTPTAATLLASVMVALLAVLGRLGALAEITSAIMLSVFAIANLALWRVHRRPDKGAEEPWFQCPRWVPVLGMFVCLWFVFHFATGLLIRL